MPPGEAAVPLALAVSRSPRLRFAGLQAYHGGAQHLRASAEREAAIGKIQIVAKVLPQAGDPVASGLRMDVQAAGHFSRIAGVLDIGERRFGHAFPRLGSEIADWRHCLVAQPGDQIPAPEEGEVHEVVFGPDQAFAGNCPGLRRIEGETGQLPGLGQPVGSDCRTHRTGSTGQ